MKSFIHPEGEARRAGRGAWSRDRRAVRTIDSKYLDSEIKVVADEARRTCER
jgi:hypothetical protein